MDDKSFFEVAASVFKPSGEIYSPLNLAYLGDAVFELLIRTKALGEGNAPVDKLSRKARNYANAAAQSEFYCVLESALTPEESAVMKRGRNAKSHSKAKNAKIVDYRRATGVEALFGYLFLKSRGGRIMELFSMLDELDNKLKTGDLHDYRNAGHDAGYEKNQE